MILKLIQKDDHVWSGLEIAFLVLSPVLGVLITRIILLLLVKPRKISVEDALIVIFKVWSAT